MATFDITLNQTLEFEGFYSADPSDPGGETIYGISHVAHPTWGGWLVVDQHRNQPDFPHNLRKSKELDALVSNFYRGIWERLHCDLMENQSVADSVFDTAVNLGEGRAIKMLQTALNVLSKQGELWPMLVVDGVAGAKTRAAILAAVKDHALVATSVVAQRGNYYTQLIVDHPDRARYARGWLRRCKFP